MKLWEPHLHSVLAALLLPHTGVSAASPPLFLWLSSSPSSGSAAVAAADALGLSLSLSWALSDLLEVALMDGAFSRVNAVCFTSLVTEAPLVDSFEHIFYSRARVHDPPTPEPTPTVSSVTQGHSEGVRQPDRPAVWPCWGP